MAARQANMPKRRNPRPVRDDPPPPDPGDLGLVERLFVARLRAGIPQAKAAEMAQELLPGWAPKSREYLRRLERGQIPEEDVDPLYLLLLAKVYRQPVEWLLGERAAQLQVVHDLLPHTLCEQRKHGSGWTPTFPAQGVLPVAS